MYRCYECGSKFDTPDYMEVCWESYFGVSSMFENKNYGTVAVCPECGCSSIEETYEDDEYDENE